jgi:hypothetical protein
VGFRCLQGYLFFVLLHLLLSFSEYLHAHFVGATIVASAFHLLKCSSEFAPLVLKHLLSVKR